MKAIISRWSPAVLDNILALEDSWDVVLKLNGGQTAGERYC